MIPFLSLNDNGIYNFKSANKYFFVQVSYMILQRVSPVTHSVGNCVKRVVVIVTSVLFFRTPVTAINAIGIISHTRSFNLKIIKNKIDSLAPLCSHF